MVHWTVAGSGSLQGPKDTGEPSVVQWPREGKGGLGGHGEERCGEGTHPTDVAGEAVAPPTPAGVPLAAVAQGATALPHGRHVGIGGLPGRRVHDSLHQIHRLLHGLPVVYGGRVLTFHS